MPTSRTNSAENSVSRLALIARQRGYDPLNEGANQGAVPYALVARLERAQVNKLCYIMRKSVSERL